MLKGIMTRWRRPPVREPLSFLDQVMAAWTNGTFLYPCCGDDGALIWPDDPDEVPLWRMERELWHETVLGRRMPSGRTRREVEIILADDIRREEEATYNRIEPQLQGPYPPDIAAQRFVEYLRSSSPGTLHELSAIELSDAYAAYCRAENIAPTHVDQVKAVLALLPGVNRLKARRIVGGRRTQIVSWLIEPVDPSEADIDLDDEAEYEDEPLRLAA